MSILDTAHNHEERIDIAIEHLDELIRQATLPRIPSRKNFVARMKVTRELLQNALDDLPIFLP